MVYWPADLL